MERMMTAYWDEDREELDVRRPSGQVFRFSGRQAVAGGHEVFGVQVIDNEIWVFTGQQVPGGLPGKCGTPRLARTGAPRHSDRRHKMVGRSWTLTIY
jgi:hypothetical protein